MRKHFLFPDVTDPAERERLILEAIAKHKANKLKKPEPKKLPDPVPPSMDADEEEAMLSDLEGKHTPLQGSTKS